MTTDRVAQRGRPRKTPEQPKQKRIAFPKGTTHYSHNARDWVASEGKCPGRIAYVKTRDGSYYRVNRDLDGPGNKFNRVTEAHITTMVREGVFDVK